MSTERSESGAGKGMEGGDDSDSWSEGLEEGEEDDETTLNEEEGQGNAGEENYEDELEDLQKEGDLPIEELLKMYGYGGEGVPDSSNSPSPAQDPPTSSRRKRPRMDEEESPHTPATEIQLPDSTDPVNAEVECGTSENKNGHGPKKSALEYLYQREEGEDSDEDDDYVPPEVWKKEIRVGPEYQADVPEVAIASGNATEGVSWPLTTDSLLWKPSAVDDSTVECYLSKIHSISPSKSNGEAEPAGGVQQNGEPANTDSTLRDDEDALYLLLKENMDSSKATGKYQEMVEKVPGVLEARSVIGPSPDIRLEAIQERMRNSAGQSLSSTWSDQDCTSFEEGLRNFGKHFHSIRNQFLPHKSVRELVQFYYSWKKTERHDLFVQRVRFEKKQYALNPNATDYMDHVLDQMDLYSQNIHGGLPLPHLLPSHPPDLPDSGTHLLHPHSQEQGSGHLDGESGAEPPTESDPHSQMLLSPTGSGLLINSDPKHVLGKFHGTHFNEWPNPHSHGAASSSSATVGEPSSADILPTDPDSRKDAAGWGVAKADEYLSLPIPNDPTNSEVSSSGDGNLLPQLAPEAIDQLLDA